MLNGLFIASIIGNCIQAVKEVLEPTIPVENRANKELLDKDIINGVPYKQVQKNIKNGKYKLKEVFPEPHRDAVDGKIIIENCTLYNEDVEKYGVHQANKWMKQGKYNLTPEELVKEHKRYEEKYKRLFSLL